MIADTGTDTHVVNRYMMDRLTNIQQVLEDAVLLHRDGSSKIEAFADAFFLAKQDDGLVIEQHLRDVAYVLSFHTNLMSLI